MTIVSYQRDLEKFFKWLELARAGRLKSVDPQSISDYQDFLRGGPIIQRPVGGWQKFIWKLKRRPYRQLMQTNAPLKVASQKRHLSTLKTFFDYLKERYGDERKEFANPPVRSSLHGIKLNEADVTPTPLLGPKDWHALQGEARSRKKRLMFLLLYYAGLRLAELRSLRFDQFDSENHTLTVVRKGGKLHRYRPEKAQEIFEELRRYQIAQTESSPYLFRNKSGQLTSSRSLYGLIKRTLSKAQAHKGISPHSFRKACATNLYNRDKDLLKVRDYLNHSDAKVTQTYIDIAH
jgi:integrase/recombinase XerC